MQTYQEFIDKHGIQFDCVAAGRGQFPGAEKDSPVMDKWACRFIMPSGKEYAFPFYMGTGLKGKAPTAEEALSCLTSDAAGTLETPFEEWCANYGYNDDSRRAESVYEACKRSALDLLALLGREEFNELMDETNEEGI